MSQGPTEGNEHINELCSYPKQVIISIYCKSDCQDFKVWPKNLKIKISSTIVLFFYNLKRNDIEINYRTLFIISLHC